MFRMVWTDQAQAYERDVASPAEITEFLATFKTKMVEPTMVEFFKPETGLALAIGLGRAESVVTFQNSLDPPYYISLGDPTREGIVTFWYGDDLNEYLSRNEVPTEEAEKALLYFLENTARPPNLHWEQL